MVEEKTDKKKKSGVKKKKISAAKKAQLAHKAEIDSLKKEVDELNDRLLRAVAEQDNMRKRQLRDRALLLDTASETVLKDILPVVDDIERSLKIPDDPEHAEVFRQGVEMISQKLTRLLKRHHVEPMVSVGQPFDVDKHDAMMQVEVADVESDIIVEEHERGYLIRDRVLRHAKVLVAK
ncbi:nucleotide exchange factor GrpE [bacterium]|nr:nucleotide exchange factor GrpE [bacterium]